MKCVGRMLRSMTSQINTHIASATATEIARRPRTDRTQPRRARRRRRWTITRRPAYA